MKASFLYLAVPVSTEVPKPLASLAQVLRVVFGSISNVQSLGFFQGTLRVRVYHDIAGLTLLPSVGPTVGAHPQTAALWASVFTKTTSVPLIRRLIIKQTNLQLPNMRLEKA